MIPMWVPVALFALMYALLLLLPERRWIVSPSVAALFLLLGILTPGNALRAVNWNVLLMLGGTMVTVSLFVESRMPLRMAEELLRAAPSVQWAAVALCLFAGVISAFVDNVATVLMFAPVGLAVAKRIGTDPVPLIISIAVSSNLQGAATLVGDTTSILLGGSLGMGFNDFFRFRGKPGIFFAVEAGALLTVPILLFLFRKEKGRINVEECTSVEDPIPAVLLVSTVVLLIAASLFPDKPEMTNGILCCAVAAVGIAYEAIRRKTARVIKDGIRAIDWKTLVLLSGLFVVIEGLTEAGVIDAAAGLFVKVGGRSPALMYCLIVSVSVVFSAFIDNIPYVAAMLPVTAGIASMLESEPYLFAFGLLIGATLGGNITPVGASANIAGIGILQKEGYPVPTKAFLRIGVPFTLTAAVSGAAIIWLIWR